MRVLRGEGQGRSATLIGVDGADGIVRFTAEEDKDDVKILQLSNLGVLAQS